MFNWADLMVHEEHCKDLMREAEMERLVRQAQPKPPKRPDRIDGSLLWMRHQFISYRRSQFAS